MALPAGLLTGLKPNVRHGFGVAGRHMTLVETIAVRVAGTRPGDRPPPGVRQGGIGVPPLKNHPCRPHPGQAMRRKKPYCPTTVTDACSEPVSCRAASSQTSWVTCPPVRS